jgi:hypothetical protein
LNGRGGTKPVKKLKLRSRVVSLVRDAKVDGMVPFKLFPPRDRVVSLAMDAKVDGMVPSNPVNFGMDPARDRRVSLVRDAKVYGMVPSKLLLGRYRAVSLVMDAKVYGMVPSKLFSARYILVMSSSVQVTYSSHEHGSRRFLLQSRHPVIFVALARSCHAWHEAALRPLLLPVHVPAGTGVGVTQAFLQAAEELNTPPVVFVHWNAGNVHA